MNIKDKICIVTGAASGIGLATTLELVNRGGFVYAADFEEKVNELTKLSDRIFPIVGNVSNCEFRKMFFNASRGQDRQIQILIPCAGITRDRLSVKLNKETNELEVYPEYEFKHILDINTVAPTMWVLEMIKLCQKNNLQSTAVFIGSVSSRGNRGQLSYSASKAALTAISATLNKEHRNFRSVVVNFGFVDTPMVQKIPLKVLNEKILPTIPLGRLILPEEAAKILCDVVENDIVTGELNADGGYLQR